jgi:hypothetical protein
VAPVPKALKAVQAALAKTRRVSISVNATGSLILADPGIHPKPDEGTISGSIERLVKFLNVHARDHSRFEIRAKHGGVELTLFP